MKVLKTFLIIIFFAFSSFCISKTKNIIFDVGGVLLEESNWKKFQIGISQLGLDCISYPNLRERTLEFIEFIEPHNSKSNERRAQYNGKDLPPLMCKWQKGEITCEALVEKIQTEADKNHNFFKDKTEQKLMKKSAKFLLPHNQIRFMKIKNSGLKLLRDLKNKKDENGQPAYNLFIISNYDSDSFNLIQKRFPKIFQEFDKDQIIVSGNVKMMKPEKNIFEHALKKFKLDPKSCILIDDQEENVESAKDCGMAVIHHKKNKHTRARLTALGIL